MKTAEQMLIEHVLLPLYNACINDDVIVQHVCGTLNLSEFELMNAFENIAQDNGFELDRTE